MKAHVPHAATALLVALALAGCRKEQPPAPTEPPGQQASPVPVPVPPVPVAMASVAPLAESVKPAVVSVDVRSRAPARGAGLPGDDPWGRSIEPWGRPGPGPRQPQREGLGSGFIVDAAGLVLTNHHVVDGAVDIRVRLSDGRAFGAKVLGSDPLTDVALLQLRGEPKELPVVRLGDSDALRVGDWLLAIGNPFGLSSSVSLGILSAKARDIHAGPYDEFLQTDAAINPGNSGGPLFNLDGEVVGINTAIAGGGSGIGFAVPSNLVRTLLPQLRERGAVTRGWLGLGSQDVTAVLAEALGLPVKGGAAVVQVEEGTPAAKAGLAPDDVITALNGKPVTTAGELTRAIGRFSPGTEVTLTVYRGAKPRDVPVTLGTRPDLEGVSARAEPRAEGEAGAEAHGGVGLSVTDVDPRLAAAEGLPARGALVAGVAPGSAAERAGLVPGMVVVEAGGKPVRGAADLLRLLEGAKPGEVLLLRVQAEGTRLLRALTVPA
uniref:S1C family peptidase n=1 Tax=Aggregicoccus edonensis TaxID=1450165 RepID=A0A3S7UVB0_9BACT|nr:S1C family peptidase [Aggregicoccus edonensis]